eukprot:scaffold7422_cov73-Skeletonema_dohrnii-CCMP3373.AAC.2
MNDNNMMNVPDPVVSAALTAASSVKVIAHQMVVEAKVDQAYNGAIMEMIVGTMKFSYSAKALAKCFPIKSASVIYPDPHQEDAKAIQNKLSRALADVRQQLQLTENQQVPNDDESTGLTAAFDGLRLDHDEVSDVSMLEAGRSDDVSEMSEGTDFKTSTAKTVGKGPRGRMQSIAEDMEGYTGPSKDDYLLLLRKGFIIQQDNHLTKEQKERFLHFMAADMESTKAVDQRIQTFCSDLEEWTKNIENAPSELVRNAAVEKKQNGIVFALRYLQL